MLLSLPWPTNWRASPGPYFPVANAIAPGLEPWLPEGGGKDRGAWKTLGVFHFPTAPRLLEKSSYQGLQEEQRDETTVKRRAGKPGGGNG